MTERLTYVRSVVHSHLYKGGDYSGVYIPKTVLPLPSTTIYITITETDPRVDGSIPIPAESEFDK